MSVYDSGTYQSLAAAISANPLDGVIRGAMCDFLMESGCADAVAAEAVPWRRPTQWDAATLFGSGRGSGSGSGIGSGRGSGSGSGSANSFREKPMRVGTAYLIHCGDWHTYTGRVVEQLGPYTFELELVSKIAETNNGDCWHELADGNERLRAACTYRHHKGRVVVPLAIAAMEWSGKLPRESNY